MDRQFLKPTRVLFARHQMLSASQKDDESIEQFSGRLKRLVEDCECTSLTVQAHKDYLVRDALISRLMSDNIPARLLELEDSKNDIDSCISLACAIEPFSDFSKSFRSAESSTVAATTKPFSQTTRRQPDRPGNSAAQQVSNKPRPRCPFCGLKQHPRQKCPAKKDTCHKGTIAKPIATKSRRHKPQDVAFMESEVNRMLAEGIIQVSRSLWRAQAFVFRDGRKPRMVIDYSQTIIRHTSKDAFPFPKNALTEQPRTLLFRKSI